MPKQNGTYSLLLATRSQSSSTASLELFVEKSNNDLHLIGKAYSYSEVEDSTCSTLFMNYRSATRFIRKGPI